jgi:hypothetical protein
MSEPNPPPPRALPVSSLARPAPAAARETTRRAGAQARVHEETPGQPAQAPECGVKDFISEARGG